MGAEVEQPKVNLDNDPKEGTTVSRYTYVRFIDLQKQAQWFGIDTNRIPKADFLKEPAKYLAELIPLVKEALDQVPNEVLRRPQERSLKPAQLRIMIERYYGLDGNPPASSYRELFSGLTAGRNNQLVAQALARCRHYLRNNPSISSNKSTPNTPLAKANWDNLGDLKEHYN